MEKKQICFLIDHIDFFITHRLVLANHLAINHDLTIITDLNKTEFNLDKEKLGKIRLVHLDKRPPISSPFSLLKYIWKLHQVTNLHGKFGTFFVTLEKSFFGCLICLFDKNKKSFFVITGMGQKLFQEKRFPDIKTMMCKYIFKLGNLRQNSFFIFQNNDDFNIFKNYKIINNKNYKVICGNGIDETRFQLKTTHQPIKMPIFLFCGRIEKAKGIIELLHAIEELLLEEYPFEFIFAGKLDNEDRFILNYFERLVSNNDNLSYKGIIQHSDIHEIYSEANILVLPSHGEGLPATGVEGLSMGMPLILSNAGGCKELIKNYENGMLHEIGNHNEIYECLRFFCQNPNKILEMGVKSRKLYQEKFSNHIIFQSYEELI